MVDIEKNLICQHPKCKTILKDGKEDTAQINTNVMFKIKEH